jgi:hypothetical protein
MRRRSRVPYIVGLIALCALSTHSRAGAQGAKPVEVHVDSLLATDTDRGMDASLVSSPLSRRLKAVFDYSTYHLIKHQDEETACGQAVAFNLPGGRILHVAPLEVDGDMIAMEVVLFERAHVMMRTELKMVKDGALILVGPRDPQETYITTIAVGVPRAPQAEAPRPRNPSEAPQSAFDLNPATPPE